MDTIWLPPGTGNRLVLNNGSKQHFTMYVSSIQLQAWSSGRKNERVCILRPKDKKNQKKQALIKTWVYAAAICIFKDTRLAMPGTILYYLCAQNTEPLAGIQSISDLFQHIKWARFRSDSIQIYTFLPACTFMLQVQSVGHLIGKNLNWVT